MTKEELQFVDRDWIEDKCLQLEGNIAIIAREMQLLANQRDEARQWVADLADRMRGLASFAEARFVPERPVCDDVKVLTEALRLVEQNYQTVNTELAAFKAAVVAKSDILI